MDGYLTTRLLYTILYTITIGIHKHQRILFCRFKCSKHFKAQWIRISSQSSNHIFIVIVIVSVLGVNRPFLFKSKCQNGVLVPNLRPKLRSNPKSLPTKKIKKITQIK